MEDKGTTIRRKCNQKCIDFLNKKFKVKIEKQDEEEEAMEVAIR
jgi:hypothetical protein